jgi:chromosome segregation ATPase
MKKFNQSYPEKLMSVTSKKQEICYLLFFSNRKYFSLKEELKSQATEIINTQNRLRETQLRFSELEGEQVPNKFSILKLQQEKSHLELQLKSIEDELHRKNALDLQYRADTTEKIVRLETQVSDLTLDRDEKAKHSAYLKVCCSTSLFTDYL